MVWPVIIVQLEEWYKCSTQNRVLCWKAKWKARGCTFKTTPCTVPFAAFQLQKNCLLVSQGDSRFYAEPQQNWSWMWSNLLYSKVLWMVGWMDWFESLISLIKTFPRLLWSLVKPGVFTLGIDVKLVFYLFFHGSYYVKLPRLAKNTAWSLFYILYPRAS